MGDYRRPTHNENSFVNNFWSTFVIQIAGLPTNINFLKKLASHHAFAAGDVDTHFIDRFKADLLPHARASHDEISVPHEAKYGAALAAAVSSIKAATRESSKFITVTALNSPISLDKNNSLKPT